MTEQEQVPPVQNVAIYARVSSLDHREHMEQQAERLRQYCALRGYRVTRVVKDIASGVDDHRPKLLSLLQDMTITRIVVEHRDRLTRSGFAYIDALFSVQGRVIEVVNPTHTDTNDTGELVADLTSTISTFCAQLYGHRLGKRTTERLVQELPKLQAQEEA